MESTVRIEEEGNSSSNEASEGDSVASPARPSVASSAALASSPAGNDDTPASFTRRKLSRKASLGQRGTVFVPAMAGLSEPNVQALREVFGLFDLEGSGKVAPAAVRAAASDAGLGRENPEVFKLLSGLTSEEPVDFEEFVSMVTDPLGDHNTKSGASRLMGLLGPEAAARGSISVEDLQRLVDDLGLDIDAKELESMVERAGADADGNLDLDAFYEVMTG
mmetsp:Transcript_23440/g.73865  ORF Transcript_23440/g.73865 Transcript_23440/m.73865 type:complete len:221 (-) Transcript_23440:95-757(-)